MISAIPHQRRITYFTIELALTPIENNHERCRKRSSIG